MLVDLGRNDLGRVSRAGTVTVSKYMEVERYSHVLHLVSHVEGRLRPDLDALDALRAVFPAGTLSGAPKVRAMQLIAAAEGERRGLYGGAVGLSRLRRQPRHGHHHPERGAARTARPTSTRARASSPAPCRSASSRRPTTRRPRSAARSTWPRASPTPRPPTTTPRRPSRRSERGRDPRRRQLRQLHVQPRPGARRRPAPTSAWSATTPSTGPASRRWPTTRRPTCAGSSSRPAPATPTTPASRSAAIQAAAAREIPRARRVPRDAVDGGRVRRHHRAGADARPRRGVRGDPRRRGPARGDAARVHGRALPLAGGRPGDAAAGAPRHRDERGRPRRDGPPPHVAAARGRAVPSRERPDAGGTAPARQLPAARRGRGGLAARCRVGLVRDRRDGRDAARTDDTLEPVR